jgi:hypothetical protein
MSDVIPPAPLRVTPRGAAPEARRSRFLGALNGHCFVRCGGLSALRRLDALAAWVLLGWLGQRLGWSVASGVLPVVVWWTVRCHGAAFSVPRALPKRWLLACAMGLLALLPLVPTGHAALALLLLAATLWGAWSVALARATGDTASTWPGMAMGLMMGSLWLASQWCLGPGWTDAQAVALHLGLMTGLPLLLWLARRTGARDWTLSDRSLTALLATGALLMAFAGGAEGRLAGMVLLVLAWSIGAHGAGPTWPGAVSPPAALGPALLLGVGLASPTLGPLSLQWAYGAVGVVALLHAWGKHLTDHRHASSPLTWKDAS